MAKQKTIWKSADGQEFNSEAAAERHDQLVKAREEYEQARNRLFQLLVGQLKTRDGQTVGFGLRGCYYVVLFEYNNPVVAEVRLSWNRWDWELADDKLRVILDWSWPGSRESQRIHIPVADLWADRDKARLACLEAQRAILDRHREELEQRAADLQSVRIY